MAHKRDHGWICSGLGGWYGDKGVVEESGLDGERREASTSDCDRGRAVHCRLLRQQTGIRRWGTTVDRPGISDNGQILPPLPHQSSRRLRPPSSFPRLEILRVFLRAQGSGVAETNGMPRSGDPLLLTLRFIRQGTWEHLKRCCASTRSDRKRSSAAAPPPLVRRAGANNRCHGNRTPNRVAIHVAVVSIHLEMWPWYCQNIADPTES